MINNSYELKIIDNGVNGEGIAKIDDLIVFVDGAIKDEVVLAKIFQQKSNFAFAKIEKILKESPHRIRQHKEDFDSEGANLKHVDYSFTLQLKQNAVSVTLQKQIKEKIDIRQIIKSKNEQNYRNKASLPFGFEDDKVFLGYFQKNSNIIKPIEENILYEKWLDDVSNIILQYANQNKISVYDRKLQKGILRHLVVRNIENNISITLVINGYKLPNQNDLIERLKQLDSKYFWDLSVNINKKNTNLILGQNTIFVYGTQDYFNYMGLRMKINPMSFFQVNNYISSLIYKNVVNEVSGNNNTVIDAYSGAGLLSGIISKNVKEVFGIEIVPEAVEDSNNLKNQNNLTNLKNFCGDVGDILPKLTRQNKIENLIIVLDPPRKGCDKNAIDAVLEAVPQKIIYISCNGATLARDLKILTSNNNYAIKYVQPYDMFPQTSEIEILTVLEKI